MVAVKRWNVVSTDKKLPIHLSMISDFGCVSFTLFQNVDWCVDYDTPRSGFKHEWFCIKAKSSVFLLWMHVWLGTFSVDDPQKFPGYFPSCILAQYTYWVLFSTREMSQFCSHVIHIYKCDDHSYVRRAQYFSLLTAAHRPYGDSSCDAVTLLCTW